MFGQKMKALEDRVKELEITFREVSKISHERYQRYRELSSIVYGDQNQTRHLMMVDVVDENGEVAAKTPVDVRDVVQALADDLNRGLAFRKSKDGYVVLREL